MTSSPKVPDTVSSASRRSRRCWRSGRAFRRRRGLETETVELEAHAERAAQAAAEAAERAAAAEAAFVAAAPARRLADPAVLSRLGGEAERLAEALEACETAAARLEEAARKRRPAG